MPPFNLDFMNDATTVVMNLATVISVLWIFKRNKKKDNEDREIKHQQLMETMLTQQKKELEKEHHIEERFKQLDQDRKVCKYESESENEKRFNQIEKNFEEQMDLTQASVDRINQNLLDFKKDMKNEMSEMKKSHASLAKSIEVLQKSFQTMLNGLIKIQSEVADPEAKKKPAARTTKTTKVKVK